MRREPHSYPWCNLEGVKTATVGKEWASAEYTLQTKIPRMMLWCKISLISLRRSKDNPSLNKLSKQCSVLSLASIPAGCPTSFWEMKRLTCFPLLEERGVLNLCYKHKTFYSRRGRVPGTDAAAYTELYISVSTECALFNCHLHKSTLWHSHSSPRTLDPSAVITSSSRLKPTEAWLSGTYHAIKSYATVM